MRGTMESTYGKAIESIMFAVNPIKKKMIKTHCIVHKYINLQAIEILKDEGYKEEYEFFKAHIKWINEGVTWADQDFRSRNHFFHAQNEKGLYGFSDSLSELKKFYNKALGYNTAGDTRNAIYYFGAACHLVQDATVPHHASNSLLKKHREFEIWIISKIMSDYSFNQKGGILNYIDLEEYIRNNSAAAVITENKYIEVGLKEERYVKIAEEIINLAEQTTAGLMIKFYKEINK